VALAAFAPAKVNLYLHVLGRRADGYHMLDSLVAFADIGDRIEATPAAELSLTVTGPEAGALAGLGDDNLVLRAARLLAAAIAEASPGLTPPGATLRLEKHLPASSGIGGGSSDAAATLRALSRLWRSPLDAARLAALAVRLGADLPACLTARPVWIGGFGERLDPADNMPAAGVVLANPRRPLPTAEVFRRRDGPFGAETRFAAMPDDAAGLAALLEARRNDLTEAALQLVPEIAAVLDCLSHLPGALLARMSGSGATCFALFADRKAALAARAVLAAAKPGWWSAVGALMPRAPGVEERGGRG
jgi:4-diphosphocytidyl-2-C-methyl-D-erythritol kinase